MVSETRLAIGHVVLLKIQWHDRSTLTPDRPMHCASQSIAHDRQVKRTRLLNVQGGPN